MATSIIRMRDGVELENLPLTVFQANPETFGFSRSRVSTLGRLGETIQMGGAIDGLDFSLTWISTDITGFEQRRLRSFFSDNESYIIDDDVFGIYQLEATVLEVNPVDFKTTTVLFEARYGTLVDVYRETILEKELTLADLSSHTVGFTGGNTAHDNRFATLQLTLETADDAPPTIWNPGTKLTLYFSGRSASLPLSRLARVSFNIGAQDSYGSWTVVQKRKRIAFDSTRNIAGEGYFASDIKFGRLNPLDTFSGRAEILRENTSVPAASSSGPYKLKIELIAPGLVE